MIVAAFLFLGLAYLGVRSGIRNTDPRRELSALFTGSKAEGPSDGNNGDTTVVNQSVDSSSYPNRLAGKLVRLPARVCVIGKAVYVDEAIASQVIILCDDYGVKVSSGHRLGSNTTHRNGGAVDFVGPEANQRALFNAAQGAGYDWVEPWYNSHTLGVDGTTGPHVHISFVLP